VGSGDTWGEQELVVGTAENQRKYQQESMQIRGQRIHHQGRHHK
jgi:hypothetical protein